MKPILPLTLVTLVLTLLMMMTPTPTHGASPLTTIQALLDSAADGDVITVPADTYTGCDLNSNNGLVHPNPSFGWTLDLSGSTIDCTSSPSARGLTLASATGTISITNGVFRGGSHPAGGGCLSATETPFLSLSSLSFVDCSSSGNGGALLLGMDLNAAVSLSSSSFTSCASSSLGGALFVASTGGLSVSLTSVNMTSNDAPSGAGIAVVSGAIVDVTGGTYSDNLASVQGGVFFVRDSASLTLVSAVTASTNKAPNGAVFAVDDSANLDVSDSSFSSNQACQGSVYYFNVPSSSISPMAITSGNTYTSNIATNVGGFARGAIFFDGGNEPSASFGLASIAGGSSYYGLTSGCAPARGAYTPTTAVGDIENILNAASDGGIYALVPGATYTGCAAVNSGSGISPTTSTLSWTLDLNAATIDCQNSGRAFHFSSATITGGTITLRNGVITGGRRMSVSPDGGAILSDTPASLFLEDLTISSSSCNNGDGGGMHVLVTPLTLTNVVFDSNSANTGGGLAMDSGSLVVSGAQSLFSYNTAKVSTGSGGGVFLGGAGTAGSFTDTTFLGNDAGQGGGVCDFVGYSYTNCNFTSNFANTDGGGLVGGTTSSHVTVTGSTFHANIADGGAAIGLFTNADATVSSSMFTSNTACEGAILYGEDPDCVFTTSSSSATPTNVFASSSYLVDAKFGGAVLIDGDTGTSSFDSGLQGSTYYTSQPCVASRTPLGPGTTTMAVIEAVLTQVDDNEAILLEPGQTYTGCAAVNSGSGIAPTTSTLSWTLDLNTATIDCQDSGRAFNFVSGAVTSPATVTLRNGIITRGFSSGADGGAIYSDASAALVLEDITVSASAADTNQDGGGLYVLNTPTTLSNSVFTSCAATHGAAVHVAGSNSLTIQAGSSFSSNTATGASPQGGALYINPTVGPVSISDSSFTSNDASLGGAIYARASITFASCNFTDNLAASTGGVLTGQDASTLLDFTSCIFADNHAANGGILALATAADATFATSTFTANTGCQGALFYSTASTSEIITTDSIVTPTNVYVSSTYSATATRGGAVFPAGGEAGATSFDAPISASTYFSAQACSATRTPLGPGTLTTTSINSILGALPNGDTLLLEKDQTYTGCSTTPVSPSTGAGDWSLHMNGATIDCADSGRAIELPATLTGSYTVGYGTLTRGQGAGHGGAFLADISGSLTLQSLDVSSSQSTQNRVSRWPGGRWAAVARCAAAPRACAWCTVPDK